MKRALTALLLSAGISLLPTVAGAQSAVQCSSEFQAADPASTCCSSSTFDCDGSAANGCECRPADGCHEAACSGTSCNQRALPDGTYCPNAPTACAGAGVCQAGACVCGAGGSPWHAVDMAKPGNGSGGLDVGGCSFSDGGTGTVAGGFGLALLLSAFALGLRRRKA